MGLFDIFRRGSEDAGGGERGGLYAAVEALGRERPESDVARIAGWAGLLGRVAYADMDLGDDELARVREILVETAGLDARDARAITELLARERVELLSLEDHLYARLINDVADREQKLDLIRALFRVAAADGTVRSDEDGAIRGIARALLLEHREFIAIRREFKGQLAVFQT